jgi:transcriptional regulator with XRE-family HTH domain
MKFKPPSERLFLEEVNEASQKLQNAIKGLSIGTLIKSIRTQLGMSQAALAKLSHVPQPTVSRIEQGKQGVSLSTLKKVLAALSCDLVIAPVMQDSIDTRRRQQARKMAEKQVRYIQGTMNLEDQQPDARFTEALLKQEEERLLQGPHTRLWEE